MPTLLAVSTCVPPYRLSQNSARLLAGEHFSGSLPDSDRLLSVFDNSGVESRFFCVASEWFLEPHSFEERNSLYQKWARDLSREAITKCLAQAGMAAGEVDHLVFVSNSGLATPSIDAQLVNELDFSPQVRRTPIFGLGCAGGAAAVARSADLVRGNTGQVVLMAAVELNSLTFQDSDFSKGNFVATALFSDGAAAVLIQQGSTEGGLEIAAAQTVMWSSTTDLMGWDFDGRGFHVIFSRRIPALIAKDFRGYAVRFLAESGLDLADIDHFVLHPGGNKVLRAFERSLELNPDRLASSREVLRQYGNMSSATILFVLKHCQEQNQLRRGDSILAGAFGPGFSAELLLLRAL